MAQPIAGTFNNATFVCGAGDVFTCFQINQTASTQMANSTASLHYRQPGVVVGNNLFIMDDFTPEVFNGTALIAFPAPPNYVGRGASMAADGTVGFYVFGGSSQPSGILRYTISNTSWLGLGSMPSPNYMFGSLLFSKTINVTTILVAQNVLTSNPANSAFLYTVTAPSITGLWSTPVTSTDSSNVNLYGATFFQISTRFFAIGGGYDGPAALAREFNGTSKQWLPTSAIPSTRRMSAAAVFSIDNTTFVGCPGL